MLRPTLTLSAALCLATGLAPSTTFAQDRPIATTTHKKCKVINSLPYKIVKSGDYCLGSSLSTAISEGRAIDIAADNVTLDLRGFELDGRAGGAYTDVVGIWAVDRKNITIANGAITGFDEGVFIGNANDSDLSRGHLVEKLRVSQSRSIGIHVDGRDSTIRKCSVSETAGVYGFGVGIHQRGSHSTVTNNCVKDTKAAYSSPNTSASGIDLVDDETRTVFGNQIDGVSGGTFNYGIRCGTPYARRNHVRNADIPFSSCDAYPDPYPYAHSSQGEVPSTRYGMAVVGALIAGLAMLKKIGVA
jgi:hypothetical protein